MVARISAPPTSLGTGQADASQAQSPLAPLPACQHRGQFVPTQHLTVPGAGGDNQLASLLCHLIGPS